MTDARRNRVAQWAYDTRGILGRFHLWLDDVEETWHGDRTPSDHAFVGESLERAFIMANAVTALGTRLFGRYAEGKGQDKSTVNRVKKDADAVSAYALSEALWYLTRNLPENHAVMVSLGEGLMPKAGETPEMGANPQLGFGRVYARPQVARFLDRHVHRMLNEDGYEWPQFWHDIQTAGITVWGAALDTLENTSRFAKGAPTGALAVFHLFDQPLRVARPYEGYMGNLVLPREVVDQAAERSILIDFLTPRRLVMDAILAAYPGIKPENVHVWTLAGTSRKHRIGRLWDEWTSLGAHLVEDGWVIPSTGLPAFTESGTYAPVYLVGPSEWNGEQHLFVCDGYSASAEAMQGASLDPILNTATSMCLFSARFKIAYDREHHIMRLDPEADDYGKKLAEIAEQEVPDEIVELYRANLRDATSACMPVGLRTSTADDFFPNKTWKVLSLSSAMLPDPYTGMDGVEELGNNVFKVTTRAATRAGMIDVTLKLRLMEPMDQMGMVFSPLLDRFYAGQNYRTRAVKISDSGRIRNELQTLCADAIEYLPNDQMVVHFDQVEEAVLSKEKKALIQEVLVWYQKQHPIWFQWLSPQSK